MIAQLAVVLLSLHTARGVYLYNKDSLLYKSHTEQRVAKSGLVSAMLPLARKKAALYYLPAAFCNGDVLQPSSVTERRRLRSRWE